MDRDPQSLSTVRTCLLKRLHHRGVGGGVFEKFALNSLIKFAFISNSTSSPILGFTMSGLMSSGIKAMYCSMVEFFEGWKPLSPLQLAVEEVFVKNSFETEATIY
ncbi:hypothetical protein Tco_0361296 [Tanacetum coccineum]